MIPADGSRTSVQAAMLLGVATTAPVLVWLMLR